MPKYAQGINTGKACMLIALDAMLDPDEWGRDFIHDYFIEFGDNGFLSDHWYLIEESAPIILLPKGQWEIQYIQSNGYTTCNGYTTFVCHKLNIRYRLYANDVMIYVYKDKGSDSDSCHAQAIFASQISFYMENSQCVTMIFRKDKLIVDHP